MINKICCAVAITMQIKKSYMHDFAQNVDQQQDQPSSPQAQIVENQNEQSAAKSESQSDHQSNIKNSPDKKLPQTKEAIAAK